MDDEERLDQWLWLSIISYYMSLPLNPSWIDHQLFYTSPDGDELRPIPESYSWNALVELKRERDSKLVGDPRRDMLENVFIPHLEHKRWELAWWRKKDLAKLDQRAEEKAGKTGKPHKQRAAPYEPAARRPQRHHVFKATKGKKTGLKWVPKAMVRCTEGTSVPEAKEIDGEADCKFGPGDALGPEACEGLKD